MTPNLSDPPEPPALVRARTLARALDSAVSVPGTGIRFGLDPVLGLIPGLGDLASSLASIYIVMAGIRLGASRSVVLRMMGNVAVDLLVGSIPILGDLFDVAWKANNMNVALLEKHVTQPRQTHRASRAVVVGALFVLIALAVLAAIGAVWVIRLLARAAR